jgi:hypothetical protein
MTCADLNGFYQVPLALPALRVSLELQAEEVCTSVYKRVCICNIYVQHVCACLLQRFSFL